MIELNFERDEPPSSRRETLRLHIDETVTAIVGRKQIQGKLTKVTQATAQIETGQLVETLGLRELKTVWVHTGGDWNTLSGHSAGAMTDRIHVRCSPAEKQRFSKVAQRKGMSLSELMRNCALQYTRGTR